MLSRNEGEFVFVPFDGIKKPELTDALRFKHSLDPFPLLYTAGSTRSRTAFATRTLHHSILKKLEGRGFFDQLSKR